MAGSIDNIPNPITHPVHIRCVCICVEDKIPVEPTPEVQLPGTVVDFGVYNIGASGADSAWSQSTPSGYGDPDEYIFFVNENGAGFVEFPTALPAPDNAEYLGDSLLPTPGAMYQVYIRAKNEAGMGTASNTASFYLLCDVPVNPAISNETNTTADLSWSAPAAGDPPTTYAIFLDDVEIATVAHPALTYQLTGLSETTNYDVHVVARNSQGDSADSATVNFDTIATPLAPSQPTSAVISNESASSADLTWIAPSSGPIPTTYAIFLDGTEIDTVAHPTVTYQITGLTSSRDYNVHVTARNAVGDSPDSNSVSFSTDPSAAPNAPGGLMWSNPTTSTVDLSWSAPASGEEIDSYVIFVNFVEEDTVAFPTLSYQLIDLEPDTSYYVTVAARNSIGDSPQSNAVAPSTLAESPNSAEYDDLVSSRGSVSAAQLALVDIYGELTIAKTPAATFAALFPTVGAISRDPDLHAEVTYLDDKDVKNENSERGPIGDFNADGTIFKYRTGTSKWRFRLVSDDSLYLEETYSDHPTHGSNYMDSFWFHPTEAKSIVYPWGAEIRKIDIDSNTITTIRDFSTLTLGDIGDANEKVNGGDGVTVRNGRILLSFGKWTNFLVYDFAADQAVKHEWNGTDWVEVLTSNFADAVFQITGVDDYATLDWSGKYIFAITSAGTELVMFDGTKISDSGGGVLHGDDAHNVPCRFEGNDAYFTNLNNGTATLYGLGVKDGIATTYTVAWDGSGNRTATFTRNKVMNFGSGNGNYGGGQYSTNGDGSKVLINSTPSTGYGTYDAYYDEIILIDLSVGRTYRARRLGKHHIASTNFEHQPEGWLSPDGTKAYWRTRMDTEINTNNKLFKTTITEGATDTEIADAFAA